MTTTPSSFQDVGLSISFADPLVKDERSGFLGRLTAEVSSYNHTIAAFEGFKSASISFTGSLNQLEGWLDGLGRDIEVHDVNGIVWNGFVNSISLSAGGLSVTRGPLTAIANRVLAIYTGLDTTTNPPKTGPSGVVTTLANDTDSQDKYGIWEKNLNAGTTTTTDAEQVRDTYLAENKNPQTGQQFTLGSGAPSISLGCLGYAAWLDAYPYLETVNSGTRQVSQKIIDVLDDDPNSIFSSDQTHVETNALLAPRYENSQITGLGAIKALVSLGDANDVRYTFGIYEDRKTFYEQMPSVIAYQQKLSDPKQRIETLIGTEVDPWRVRPARWLFYSDFLIGEEQPTALADFRTDPRFEFIESVTYTAPYGINHSGGKTDTIPQLLAKRGIGGSA